jgi:hypothetical protein
MLTNAERHKLASEAELRVRWEIINAQLTEEQSRLEKVSIVGPISEAWIKMAYGGIRLIVIFVGLGGEHLKRPRVHSPPGHLLAGTLRFWFPDKVFQRLFAETIIAMREDHASALAAGEKWRAKWLTTLLNLILAFTVVHFCYHTIVSKVLSVFKLGS